MAMTTTNLLALLSLALGVVTAIVVPLLIWAMRNVARSQRVEDKLLGLAEDIRDVVTDIKDFKKLMDRRVTWLEQNIWRK